jgi:hypothetical protein
MRCGRVYHILGTPDIIGCIIDPDEVVFIYAIVLEVNRIWVTTIFIR